MISAITYWIKKNFFHNPDSMILNQQYKLLLTKFEKIKFERQIAADSNTIALRIDELFQQDQNWTNLSQIELYLVPLYTDQEISMELKIKLMEAREKLLPGTVSFFETEIRAGLSVLDQKMLLNSLNEKLQLSDDVTDLEDRYIAVTRIRTSFLFFLVILMFFAVDQLPGIADFLKITAGSKADAVVTAMSAGWLGSTFSMLVGLRNKLTASSLQDLKVIHRFDYIFSRTIIGLTSGLLVYYLFQSQLVTGSFFPSFNSGTPVLSAQGTALLVVWCFISGFSEKLVPDLIAQTEKKIVK